MPELFFDTAGWGHLLSQTFHERASAIYHRAVRDAQRIVTSNYVLAELVALLTFSMQVPRPSLIALVLVETLRTSPHVEVVHIDPTLDTKAWQLLTERPDKEWSLVDCASFVVMRERRIAEALTTDHHFEQAGFVALLKA